MCYIVARGRYAAFSFCDVSSVEMVSSITTLILTASHLGYSSAYAILSAQTIDLRQVASLSALEND